MNSGQVNDKEVAVLNHQNHLHFKNLFKILNNSSIQNISSLTLFVLLENIKF